MKDVWKKFDETEPSHSSIHHLMAIYQLHKKNGYARGIDVAHFLNITRGSVSITLTRLKDKEYINEDENKFYCLTDEGQRIVNSVLSKRHILERFFTEVLQVPDEIAEIDACKIEHLLSNETGEKLICFLGYYLSGKLEAVNFREGFDKFNYQCHSVSNCQVCEMNCFFAGKEISFCGEN
jgi:DtxR family Mn-dependent transcriptional regulator